MTKPTESPLTKLAQAAFRRVVNSVIKLAEESGTPVLIWQNNQLKRLNPKDISQG